MFLIITKSLYKVAGRKVNGSVSSYCHIFMKQIDRYATKKPGMPGSFDADGLSCIKNAVSSLVLRIILAEQTFKRPRLVLASGRHKNAEIVREFDYLAVPASGSAFIQDF